MSIPSFTTGGTGTGTGSGVASSESAQPGAPGAEDDGEVSDESAVSARAIMTAQPVLAYPREARAAEIEADIPVEIVVDATGHVVQARVPKPVGFGLDEAAIDTLRRTHFRPAQRHGRSVAVRMKWTMQFRLQ
jgi:TonB family protein